MRSWRVSVEGVWKKYGDEEGIARRNVRRGERRSVFGPVSVRRRRIKSSGSVG